MAALHSDHSGPQKAGLYTLEGRIAHAAQGRAFGESGQRAHEPRPNRALTRHHPPVFCIWIWQEAYRCGAKYRDRV